MHNLSEKTAATVEPSLPDDLTLGAVHLVVTDLDRSVRFYERSIGLRIRDRDDETAWLGAGAADLIVLHARPGAGRAGRHAGLYHLALLHPTRQDLARALHRLAATDTAIQGASDHGISEAIYLPDPDGNGIELAADRPREHWGDLRDPTTVGPRPLDLAGLAALVPAGEAGPHADRDVRVGHLHLHVGDVEDALAFYRDVIGFEVMTRFQGAAFLSAGGYHHHLGVNTWRGEGAPAAPAGAVGLERWTVNVDPEAITAVTGRLATAGIPFAEQDGTIAVDDPWGMTLELVAPATP